MTCIDDTRPNRKLSAKRAVGLALSGFLALGLFATSAFADWHGDRHGYYGGYYGAPPVVYGSPYYYPPPVVYGPGIGINLPFVNIGIH
jgi:hypothetical protein